MANRKQPAAHTTYGNVAYDLRNTQVAPQRKRQQEQQEQQPRRKRQQGQRPAPQPQPREQQSISLFAVTGFAVVILLAVLVLTSYIQLNGVYSATHSLENQLTALETEADILEAEYNDLFDTVTLSKAAEEAGLVAPNSTQKIYLEMTEADSAVVYTPTEQPGLLEQIGNDLQSFWRSILSYFAQ